jgi:hypothetical protein
MEGEMEVSNQEPGGQQLLDTVAELTGLPEPLVQQELHEILESAGQNAGSVTLDALREAMLLYLEAMAEPLERAEREEEAKRNSLNLTNVEDLSFIPSI